MSESTARQYDANGWFEIKKQPLSKAGVFPYLGKNIRGAPDPTKFYLVLRSPEALSNPDFIDTLKLSPWIDEHAMLGNDEERPGVIPAEQKGVGGVIGEQVYFDPNDNTLYGNVKAFSEAHKNTIDVAGKKELSLGYWSQYLWEPGIYEGQPYDVVQIPRYGNHLASVKDGRMGSDVAVLDCLDHFTFTVDSKEFVEMKLTKKEQQAALEKLLPILGKLGIVATAATLDEDDGDPTAEPGEAEMSLDDAIAAVSKLIPIFEKFGITIAAPTKPAEPATTPPAIAVEDEDDPDKKKEPAATMDAADIAIAVRKDIAAASRLAGELSKVVGTFDHSEMSEQQVAEYGVQKLQLGGAKGSEVPTLRGYLAAVAKQPTTKPVTATLDNRDNVVPFFQKQLDERAVK